MSEAHQPSFLLRIDANRHERKAFSRVIAIPLLGLIVDREQWSLGRRFFY